MFSTYLKFNACFKYFVVEFKFVVNPRSVTDFICTESQRAQTNSFLKSSLSHKLQLLNVQHNFCRVMCYTVLIMRTVILLTFEINILLQSFN